MSTLGAHGRAPLRRYDVFLRLPYWVNPSDRIDLRSLLPAANLGADLGRVG